MYLCSPVLGSWTIMTWANGSYIGYFSMTLSPREIVTFAAGGGGAISFFFLRLNLRPIFSFESEDCCCSGMVFARYVGAKASLLNIMS